MTFDLQCTIRRNRKNRHNHVRFFLSIWLASSVYLTGLSRLFEMP